MEESDMHAATVSPASDQVFNPALPASRILHKYDSRLTPTEDNIIGTVILCIGILGVVANSWLLKGFYQERKTLKPPTFFLANLCVSDLITLFFSYPCSFTSFFAHGWAFGEEGCIFYGTVSYFSGTAGIFSLTGIAFMRYIKTCHPNGGQWLHSKRSTWRFIGFIYAFSLFWALLPCLGWGSYEVEPSGLACSLNWWTQDASEIVQLLLACIFICFIPVALMVFFYYKIHRRVRTSSRNIARHTRAAASDNKVVRFVRNNAIVSETRITVVSATLCLGMIIAWVPYTVVCLVSVFAGRDYVPVRLTVIPLILAKASHGYNPLIYFMATREKRNQIKRFLGCVGTRNNNDEERPYPTQTNNFRVNTAATQFPSPVLIPSSRRISSSRGALRSSKKSSSGEGSWKHNCATDIQLSRLPSISSTKITGVTSPGLSPSSEETTNNVIESHQQKQYSLQHHQHHVVTHQQQLADDRKSGEEMPQTQPISCLTVAVLVSSTTHSHHLTSTSTLSAASSGGLQSFKGSPAAEDAGIPSQKEDQPAHQLISSVRSRQQCDGRETQQNKELE